MREFLNIMFPKKEWDDVNDLWRKRDIRVIAYPLILIVVFILTSLIGE